MGECLLSQLVKIGDEIKVNSSCSYHIIMHDPNPHLITVDPLHLAVCDEKKINVSVLRLDKIHPVVSGNKFFKLQPYLQKAIELGKKTIVTYGGAWSNHIAATAAACRLYQLQSIGIIRGEETSTPSATLSAAKKLGMELIFMDRDTFKQQKRNPLPDRDDYYYINEGGFGVPGAMGASAILNYCNKQEYTHFCCAAGTGTMTAGLLAGILPQQRVVSLSVLKNNRQLENDIEELTGIIPGRLYISHAYHFGGYAKYNPALLSFMNSLYTLTDIPTDFVYTGKLFFGITDLINTDYFPAGSNILVIHSGGLQGNRSLNKGTLIF
jgi:1-aminocyclopropane-1-carboxylate deaminase